MKAVQANLSALRIKSPFDSPDSRPGLGVGTRIRERTSSSSPVQMSRARLKIPPPANRVRFGRLLAEIGEIRLAITTADRF
jgi:hypothetical protein